MFPTHAVGLVFFFFFSFFADCPRRLAFSCPFFCNHPAKMPRAEFLEHPHRDDVEDGVISEGPLKFRNLPSCKI